VEYMPCIQCDSWAYVHAYSRLAVLKVVHGIGEHCIIHLPKKGSVLTPTLGTDIQEHALTLKVIRTNFHSPRKF
jgi:hypothetical protein